MTQVQSQTDPSLRKQIRYDATVVIVTKNRKDDLRKAVESAVEQQGRVEVLVIDDGSTDGTAEMIRQEFPAVYLDRVEESRGYIVHRNRAADLARSPVIFSLDDDAAFASPGTVQHTLAEFNHPRVGAVAIPNVDVNRPGQPRSRPAPTDPDAIWAVDTYRGTAHAVRRDLFAKLGGYRASFFHQGEEGEFCIRMLNAGFITRLGTATPINHFESPKRDRSRMILYATRNKMLFTWYNVPQPYALVHLPLTVALSLVRGVQRRYTSATLRGVSLGMGAILKEIGERRPVSRSVYRLSRRLRKQGPARLEAIESQLPPQIPLDG